MEILEGYSVGTLARRIQRTYWYQLQMVSRAGVRGLFGKAFQGLIGVTQGEPLPPTIFNMVVDKVVWNWLEDMVDRAVGQGACGQESRHQTTSSTWMTAW